MQQRPTGAARPLRLASLLLIVVSLVIALLTMATPSANAHSGDFEHDDRFPGTTCPAGTVSNGASADNLFGRLGPYVGCTHTGYSAIGNNVELCEAARGRITSGWCTFDRAQECGVDPAFVTNIGDGMCLRVALALNELLPARSRTVRQSAIPICAETERAQELGQALPVGGSFWDAGAQYTVITGEPSCTVNCIDGWDMNCDGKIGDFCASEYDLSRVADIGWCMEDRGISPT